MLTDASPETLECRVATASFTHEPAIAFVRNEQPIGEFVMLTPTAVSGLIDSHVNVFMQNGFSAGSPFTDMDYADVGVEFVDDFFQLTRMSRTLVKFQPFTEEQVRMAHDEQILISTQTLAHLTAPYLQLLIEKQISAIGLNLLKDPEGRCLTDRILTETLSPVATSIALSNLFLPMLMNFVCSPRLRFALQRSPQLMAATYCFEGKITNREIAEAFHLPLHDIVHLCWDLN